MIKLKITVEDLTLKDINKVEVIEKNEGGLKGHLYKNEVIICDREMADYLLGNNPLNKSVAEIIEIIPDDIPKVENVEETIEKIKVSAKEEVKKAKKTKK